jgi:hypothetical protein
MKHPLAALAVLALFAAPQAASQSSLGPARVEQATAKVSQTLSSTWLDTSGECRQVYFVLPSEEASSGVDNGEQHVAAVLAAMAVFEPSGQSCGASTWGLPAFEWLDALGFRHGASSYWSAVKLQALPGFAPTAPPTNNVAPATAGQDIEPVDSLKTDWTDALGFHHEVVTERWSTQFDEGWHQRHFDAVMKIAAQFPPVPPDPND